jgi:uncharacterized membrane protein YfcA
MGGPPIAMVYQNEPGAKLRGTLAAYFTVGATMSLVALAVIGRFARWELVQALALLPGMLLGFFLSAPVSTWLERGRLRVAVLAVSAASGVALMLRALF